MYFAVLPERRSRPGVSTQRRLAQPFGVMAKSYPVQTVIHFSFQIKNKAGKRNCSNVQLFFWAKEKVFSRSRGKDFFRRASYPSNKKRRGSKMIQSSRIILTRTALCSPTINGTALVRIENDTVIPSSFRLARRLVVQPVKVPSACSNRVLIQLCGYYSTAFRILQ